MDVMPAPGAGVVSRLLLTNLSAACGARFAGSWVTRGARVHCAQFVTDARVFEIGLSRLLDSVAVLDSLVPLRSKFAHLIRHVGARIVAERRLGDGETLF